MRMENVLSAVATGVWSWDSASGTTTFDAESARLLELPPIPTVMDEASVRAHFHPVDWAEIKNVVDLALAEGTLAEGTLRIVNPENEVVRVVRSRSLPRLQGESLLLVGTMQEVPDPQPGTTTGQVRGDWRRSREAFLLDAGRALAEARSTTEILRVTAGLSMPGFTPDGQAVFGVEGDHLRIIGYHGYDGYDERPFADMPLDADYPACEVVRTGRVVYLPSSDDYRARFPAVWPLVESYGRLSWAYVPLVAGGRTIGAWMAAFSDPVRFTPDERSILTTVARMLAHALSRTAARESEQELSLGLQRSMMPTVEPDIEGMQVAARYVPTGGGLEIGGDWYDMIPLPSGRIALVIGDVQGHDVRAAGLMGQLRIALRAYASEGHHPDAVLARASRFLAGLLHQQEDADPAADVDPRFATCLYIEVDPATGTLDIARAGHPDPATRLTDGTLLVRPTAGGLPLGIEPDTDYPTTRLVLEPGELMLVCTDGLIETGGHDLDTGWARLHATIDAHCGEQLEQLADALVSDVHGPSSHHTTGPLSDRREDDIALLLLGRDAVPAGSEPEPVRQLHPARRTVLTVPQAEHTRVSVVRGQLRQLMHDWSDVEQVDAAVLLLSEMVTNVLLHTDGDAMLVAEMIGSRGDRRLRVDVADPSDELPRRRQPGEMASSGRGLMMLELLAHAWGVDPRGEGKCIWFEIYEGVSEPGSAGPEPVVPAIAMP
ncbi:ATP-binding SpoIIE family protein phosphatase [Streptomyces meridianus]|uniref:SpoIIE family protein phosphatase n=1 Tax=Streptomyces meridianus TaxID=2938945 RepID=A0ABT0X624_9ACTN|nr:SpoIIE family protein phosphatase [Streptomyces meridianus]MCM2577990.1 SpoIIE family protein phosphatase [Streptomyces meridianus]